MTSKPDDHQSDGAYKVEDLEKARLNIEILGEFGPMHGERWDDDVPGFKASNIEIVALAEFWMEEAILEEVYKVWDPGFVAWDWLRRSYERFEQLAEILGEEISALIRTRVKERIRRDVGEEVWNKIPWESDETTDTA